MAEKPRQPPPISPGQSVDVELDSLNAEVHSRRNATSVRRHRMEAKIDADSRKRRRHEAPVSSAFKKT
jgi:hypothetical protein